MNRPFAFAEETMCGWIGRFRLAWRTEAFPVRASKDGPVIYFSTADEAEVAAWRVKHKIEDSKYRREGDKAACLAADTIFRPGKKPIPVERRRA